MNIETIKRPWSKAKSQGNRYNRDPFYNSSTHRNNREAFRQGFTVINGFSLSNTFCHQCYKDIGIMNPGSVYDHIIPISHGGHKTDHNNAQTLCDTCHAKKSAREGNSKRK